MAAPFVGYAGHSRQTAGSDRRESSNPRERRRGVSLAPIAPLRVRSRE